MKERKKREKKPVKKEEITEVFEIEKEGKEKTVEIHREEKTVEKIPSKSMLNKEKKIFIGILVTMMGFVLMFAVVYLIINSSKNITVNGVSFYIDKEDMVGTTLYRTSIPVITNNKTVADYNFYLRKDPRILKNIKFEGNIEVKKNMVINMTEDFICGGNGMIAVANVVKLYSVIGADVIKDPNATCNADGLYMLLRIEPGNETKVVQTGPSCYKIYVKDCEILEGTERFMLETFSTVKKITTSSWT